VSECCFIVVCVLRPVKIAGGKVESAGGEPILMRTSPLNAVVALGFLERLEQGGSECELAPATRRNLDRWPEMYGSTLMVRSVFERIELQPRWRLSDVQPVCN
jgi:hypothetical protein